MTLKDLQLRLLGLAASELTQPDLRAYFELKQLLPRPGGKERHAFESRFAIFYGLNAAAVSAKFKQQYFEKLFDADPTAKTWPDYRTLLRELYVIPTRKKTKVFPASFVSKLVATRDESRPLYDRHVANFFGLAVPATGSTTYRSEIFVSHLESLRDRYTEWSNRELMSVLEDLRHRIPPLTDCHSVRLCDFLVWTVGRKKLSESAQ